MTPVWQTTRAYAILRTLVDLCTRCMFSKVTIEGKENLPERDSAVILAPNHSAAMVDPCLLLLLSPHKAIAFGARSDIFKKPRIASVLHWIRILPIARARNGREEVIKNHKTFEDIIDCLAHGTPFCLYPEGTHFAAPGMLPLKKGVYRIASMAAERLKDKDVFVVPVGVDYESFFHEMKQAAVRIGKPINFREFHEEHSNLNEVEIIKSFLDELRNRDLQLIDQLYDCSRERWPLWVRIPLGIILIPVFIVCAILSAIIWIPKYFVMRSMTDKAWTHTVEYSFRLFVPVLWPFINGFRRMQNLYHEIIEDIRFSE